MAQTDYADFETKTPGDRTVMHVLYAMHTVAPFTLWSLSLIALIVNYIRRADETDALYIQHHNYMVSTFWWTVLWLILSGFVALVMTLTVVLILLVWLPFTIVGLWYIYRFVRGWMRFTDGRAPA